MQIAYSYAGWQHARAPRGRLTSRVSAYAAVAFSCVAFDLWLPAPAGVVLSAATFTVWAVWLALREAREATFCINPIVTYLGWQAAELGLATAYVALHSGSELIPFGISTITAADLAYGHALMVTGSFPLYWGMKRYQPREMPRGVFLGRRTPMTVLAAAIHAGAALQIFREPIEQTLGTMVSQLGVLPLAGFCLLALRPPALLERSSKAHLCGVLAGTAILAVLNSRGDSKMQLMYSFLPLALWAVRRGNRGKLLVLGAALSLVYVFAVAPYVTTFRETIGMRRAGSRGMLAAGASEQVVARLNYTLEGDLSYFAKNWLDVAANRMCEPIAVGMVHTLVRERGYLMGEGMEYVLYAGIPRAIWPDKPRLDRGRYFTSELGMAADESSATSSTGQTAAGELYWNFGWCGVLAGMYILGAALSGLWWRSTGPDPTAGVLEMTAFTGVTTSFVLGIGSTAGTLFFGAVMASAMIRSLILVRDKLLRPQTATPGYLARHVALAHTRCGASLGPTQVPHAQS